MKIALTVLCLATLTGALVYLASTYFHNGKSFDDNYAHGTNAELLDYEWVWQYTELTNGERVEAPRGDQFVLSFDKTENRVFSTTDCNSMGGIYSKDGQVLSFGEFARTLMYCEGSLEELYSEHLALVTSYVIVGDMLRFSLGSDYGVMVFERLTSIQ